MTWRGWESYVPPMDTTPQRDPVRPSKRAKYGAVRTTVDGIVFDSKKEAARYQELKALEKAGAIRNLKLQPEFPLSVKAIDAPVTVIVGKYRGDFQYEELTETGGRWDLTVEDVKGVRTPVYRLKKKMLRAQYGITIRET